MGPTPSPLLRALRSAGRNLASFLAVRFGMKGAPTRAVASTLNQVLGTRLSHSTLSNALEPIPEAWQKRPLPENLPYLSTSLPLRRPGSTASQALLLALGVDSQGHRHFLGFFLGDCGSWDSWEASRPARPGPGPQAPPPRGLRRAQGEDAGAEALGCPHQLCLVHKVRNLRSRVSRSDWKAFLADFKAIYWASSRESSLEAKGRFQERWGKTYPKAVAIALERFEAFSRFMAEPRHTWRALRSTNPIERFNREVQRRTRPAGAMHSELELAKLLYSVVEGQEASWAKRKLWGEVKTRPSADQVA